MPSLAPGRPSRQPHSRIPLACLAATLLLLQGCAPPPAGSIGETAFLEDSQPTLLTGPRPSYDAARCFRARASFLPGSDFEEDEVLQRFTYRLQLAGLWFEQIDIEPLHRGMAGSLAQVRVAPTLDAQWRRRFNAQRLSVLRQCLAQ